MNKFTKVCLIISLVLVAFSAVCFSAGVALGSGLKEVQQIADEGGLSIGRLNLGKHRFYYVKDKEDMDNLPIQKGKISESFPAEDISELNMEIYYGEISFIDSTSDQIEVNIDAPERNSYICKKDKKRLVLEDTTSNYKIGMAKNNVSVTIAIPEGKVFKSAEVITNAGKIKMKHVLNAEKLSLELDAGELDAGQLIAEKELSVEVGAGSAEVSDFSAGELEVDCGIGELVLKGSVTKDVSAECGMGRLELALSGNEEDYDYEISCGIGEVTINDDTFSGLSREVSVDHGAKQEISLECGIGEIDVTIK